jgi:hypothetical protein
MPSLWQRYTLLFVLNIILINPWETSQGDVRTMPEVISLHLIPYPRGKRGYNGQGVVDGSKESRDRSRWLVPGIMDPVPWPTKS